MSLLGNSKKWRESDTIKFVELYEKAECLWNFRHPVYKHRDARNKAIEYIIQEMNMPDFGVNELKNKIKNIRSTYQQEVNKIRRSKTSFGGDIIEEYRTNLAWFPIADRFLSKVINSTKNLAKPELDDNSFTESNQQSLFNLVETQLSNDTNPELEEKYSPFALNIEQIKEEFDHEEFNPPPVVSHTTKRRRLSQHQNHLYDGSEANSSMRQEQLELLHTNDEPQIAQRQVFLNHNVEPLQDEWYYFGNNIACQFRSLPLERALQCQRKFIDILTQERIDYINAKARNEENDLNEANDKPSSTEEA